QRASAMAAADTIGDVDATDRMPGPNGRLDGYALVLAREESAPTRIGNVGLILGACDERHAEEQAQQNAVSPDASHESHLPYPVPRRVGPCSMAASAALRIASGNAWLRRVPVSIWTVVWSHRAQTPPVAELIISCSKRITFSRISSTRERT